MFSKSAWTYNTGATGGAGIAIVAASGGVVYLNDPAAKTHRLIFGGLGAGFSLGFKIPRFPKVNVRGRSVGGAGSITDFPSVGQVLRADRLGRELTLDDLRGAIVFVDAGGGLVVGGSGTAMLFGINSALLLANLASPVLSALFLDSVLENATGMLLMTGMNAGLQAGGGAAGLVGYMY